MSELLEISFPGGKRVDVQVGGFDIGTDQSVKNGGEASAPAPFTLFLASLASCSGIYALNFCQTRKLPTDGLSLTMEWEGGGKSPANAVARMRLRLPDGFPDRYRSGIVKAMDLCAVKKQMLEPPTFEIQLEN